MAAPQHFEQTRRTWGTSHQPHAWTGRHACRGSDADSAAALADRVVQHPDQPQTSSSRRKRHEATPVRLPRPRLGGRGRVPAGRARVRQPRPRRRPEPRADAQHPAWPGPRCSSTSTASSDLQTDRHRHADVLEFGAGVRQYLLEDRPGRRAELCRCCGMSCRYIGHVENRHRGTVGGSLAHADSAAELPCAAVTLDATIVVRGPRAARESPPGTSSQGCMTDRRRRPTSSSWRSASPCRATRHGYGFAEVARREGDFALAPAGAVVTLDEHGSLRLRSPSASAASPPPPCGPPRSSRRWSASCRPSRRCIASGRPADRRPGDLRRRHARHPRLPQAPGRPS